MVRYIYKAGSQVIDYSADANEEVSVQDATAMALIDVVAQLKELKGESGRVAQTLDNISDAVDSIRQSVG